MYSETICADVEPVATTVNTTLSNDTSVPSALTRNLRSSTLSPELSSSTLTVPAFGESVASEYLTLTSPDVESFVTSTSALLFTVPIVRIAPEPSV